jgi:AcrR family transcriptional regulator
MSATASKREATKQANREAILGGARSVFSELGFGASTVRDIVRSTGLATGTFYNYFPDKEAVLRALVDDIAAEARLRVREARRSATTLDGFVAGGFRAYFAFLAGDPATVALMRRNAGTIRTLFGEPALGAGADELQADLRDGVESGALPTHDTELMAAAMVGAGVEVGMRMVEREPLDVEEAVMFCTNIFLGAFSRL